MGRRGSGPPAPREAPGPRPRAGARTWVAASRSCALRAAFLSVSRALCSLRPRPVKSDTESAVAMAGTRKPKGNAGANLHVDVSPLANRRAQPPGRANDVLPGREGAGLSEVVGAI